jgi:uncharacterized protein
MWVKFARFILRNRTALLVALGLTTAIMLWQAVQVKMSYEGNQLIPSDDPEWIAYQEFRKTFGVDGNIMVVGVQTDDLFQLDFFNDWAKVTERVGKLDMVQNVVSISNLPALEKNSVSRRFDFVPIVKGLPQNQDDLDAIQQALSDNKLYEGILLNSSSNTTLMAISFDRKVLNSPDRVKVVKEIEKVMDAFGVQHDLEVHYSGLPYIRTIFATKVADELRLFSLLAVAVTGLVLFLFFRSISAVLFPVLVVVVGAIWAMGLIQLFGYKLTMLTGLIPPLIVVIGIPNCVYLLNKYHDEFRKHGNKIKALSRIVEKIGIATLITNATTAIGFGVFYFTDSSILKEFGLVVSISIMLVFMVSIIMIPTVFSYLPAPEQKQIKHLENKNINALLEWLIRITAYRRKYIFGIAGVVVLVAALGITRLNALSFIVDDIPEHDRVYTDLKFFEKHFKGIMPFEILIDTGRKGGAQSTAQMAKAEEVQRLFSEYPIFAKPISLIEVIKGANQAYFNNNPDYYRLPNSQERGFVLPYLIRTQSGAGGGNSSVSALTDSNRRIIRISMSMSDVGTDEMARFFSEVQPRVDSIFEGTNNKVSYTGQSLIFLKGNTYLINSLISSLLLAFVLIALIVGLMFRSMRIMVLSLLTNLIPLMVTAGAMGYLGIALKPSTVLIFSIAFGIAVDDSIHFLTKYRQELERHSWDIAHTVRTALRETGASMFYTSIILFFGFIIFAASNFGGTIVLGIMTSTTLLVAMFSNLIILPALLLRFDKRSKRHYMHVADKTDS